ncbi:MAG: hypothetical protein KF814_10940 [Nitrospiraceae bacterium]|nr:hypothetical protein [Nitrospiraceae bacterium]
MNTTEYFSIVNEFFGWGDPGSQETPGIWFIGIEEGGAWPNAELLRDKGLTSAGLTPEATLTLSQSHIKIYQARYEGKAFLETTPEIKNRWKNSRWQGPRRISRIVSELSRRFEECRDHNPDEPWEYYEVNMLWEKGSSVCQANLYPIGRPKLRGWFPHYTQLFGLHQEEWERNKIQICGPRLEKLRELWRTHQPQATICFGLSYQQHFKQSLFPPPDFKWAPADGNRIHRCEKEHILIVHHLSRVSNKVLSSVRDILKDWHVVIP